MPVPASTYNPGPASVRGRKWNVLTCAFCGEAYPGGTPSTQHAELTAHIFKCESHPLKETITCLRLVLDSVDYGAGACRQNEMVGAVLPQVVLDRARKAARMSS